MSHNKILVILCFFITSSAFAGDYKADEDLNVKINRAKKNSELLQERLNQKKIRKEIDSITGDVPDVLGIVSHKNTYRAWVNIENRLMLVSKGDRINDTWSVASISDDRISLKRAGYKKNKVILFGASASHVPGA